VPGAGFPNGWILRQRQPSRAVNRIRNSGRPDVFGVEADRFDHKVEFIGAVDFARYAVSHFGLDEQGFGEVIEPVNPLGVVVLEQEHRARTVFRPREQEQVMGAEVEHEGRIEEKLRGGNQSGDQFDLRPSAAPLRGYPTDSSGSGYHHIAALDRCRK
jgi:hypothetical protein